MLQISSLINSSLELEEVLENIMTTSRSILGAGRAVLCWWTRKAANCLRGGAGPVAHKLKGEVR